MGTHPRARNLRPGRAAACGACVGEGGMSSKKLSDTVKMVELYRKGQTLRDIADVFGCSMQNVHRRLQDCMEQRSEEHTSELQSLMRISYAVFCLKKKNKQQSR